MIKKSIPALKLDQSIEGIVTRPDAFVFQMMASELLEIATVSTRLEKTDDNKYEHSKGGFQRILKGKRCNEINDFVREEYGFLPNNLILSFPEKSLYFIANNEDRSSGKLEITLKEGQLAFIIDGQHRLYAFHKDYNKDMIDIPLSVTAYHGLKENQNAEIFRAINEKQQKIPKSLIYDLIPLAKFDDSFPTERGQAIAEILNYTKTEMDDAGYDYDVSALSQRLYIDGRRSNLAQPINFSSAVNIFAKEYLNKANAGIFTQNGFQPLDIQVKILINFLNSFKGLVGKNFWEISKDSVFTQSLGITALLEKIPEILRLMQRKNIIHKEKHVPSQEEFFNLFNELFQDIEADKKDLFSSKTYKQYKRSFREAVNKLKEKFQDRINAIS
ncbi:MAG: DGQHR domain-containing protein [Candidatus Gastranaerophilales bacterium]|nr:DGQHR domain-containing protein [Candidatus Gastranaerophilales bacterium]